MTSRLVGLVALAAAGCPAGDDTTELDGATAAGLIVIWSTAPAVPGPVGAAVVLDNLELRVSSLRVIGDAAASGDPRTTRGTTTARWGDGEVPQDVELPTAPPGLYARLELGVGGDDERLEVAGQALVGGIWYAFEIEDERQRALSVTLSLALAPGTRVTLPVTCDLDALLAGVPFDQMPIEDGDLAPRDSDLDALWAGLDTALTVTATATAATP